MAAARALEDRRWQARQAIELYASTLARRAGVRVELFNLLTDGGEGPSDWQARQVRTLEDVAAFLAALASTATPHGAADGADVRIRRVTRAKRRYGLPGVFLLFAC